jgi:hypothetical protein
MSHDADEYEVLAVSETIVQLGASPEATMECIKTLLDRCVDNWRFSASAVHCATLCFNDDRIKAVCGSAFRQQFLKQLQALYKRKFI